MCMGPILWVGSISNDEPIDISLLFSEQWKFEKFDKFTVGGINYVENTSKLIGALFKKRRAKQNIISFYSFPKEKSYRKLNRD